MRPNRGGHTLFSVESQNYLYRLESGTSLVPANAAADLPPLDFERTPEYWAQFPRGSTHSFRLLRGPWGYWQIDYSEIDERHRAFYQRRPQATSTAP